MLYISNGVNKLFTEEDPYNIHKTFGFLTLSNFAFQSYYYMNYGEMFYISRFSSPLDKNITNVKLIKENDLSIKDDENIVIEDSSLVKMFNLKHPNIINLSEYKKSLDAISQIEALESNDYKEKNFNLKTTLPDYADHEV